MTKSRLDPGCIAWSILLALLLCTSADAQTLTPAERAAIDMAAQSVLETTRAPSASISVVRGGAIVYEQAYGADGRITPQTAATPSMRYGIGSISKQFTATAVLLLAEERKLSLDDKVAKWLPELARAKEISVRQLLSMTAGYQDYWPQDYVLPDMLRPIAPQALMQRWAGKAVDFAPGTKWQYSNTNYVIAAVIVERVAGMSLIDFLRQRVFTPLKMTSVEDLNATALGSNDAEPLLRNGLGPLRVAPREAAGWLFGAGQLAMTAHDLSLWNIAVMNRTVLRTASYAAQQTDVRLSTGTATGYGLGVTVGVRDGRRLIAHGGAVSGYTSTSFIFPDDRASIVVFTNIYPGADSTTSRLAGQIANVIFPAAATAGDQARNLARKIYDGLMKGTIDRALFTPSANAYFTAEVLSDYASSLGPLGAPAEFTPAGDGLRGGMTIRSFHIRAGSVVMSLTMMTLPDGRIDQYIVSRAG